MYDNHFLNLSVLTRLVFSTYVFVRNEMIMKLNFYKTQEHCIRPTLYISFVFILIYFMQVFLFKHLHFIADSFSTNRWMHDIPLLLRYIYHACLSSLFALPIFYDI